MLVFIFIDIHDFMSIFVPLALPVAHYTFCDLSQCFSVSSPDQPSFNTCYIKILSYENYSTFQRMIHAKSYSSDLACLFI